MSNICFNKGEVIKMDACICITDDVRNSCSITTSNVTGNLILTIQVNSCFFISYSLANNFGLQHVKLTFNLEVNRDIDFFFIGGCHLEFAAKLRQNCLQL